MIDTLYDRMNHLIKPSVLENNSLEKGKYIVLTLHRPSNLDEEENLTMILKNILSNIENNPVAFPIHPRTANVLKKSKFNHKLLVITEPIGYL